MSNVKNPENWRTLSDFKTFIQYVEKQKKINTIYNASNSEIYNLWFKKDYDKILNKLENDNKHILFKDF
jgi:hypothetical protein